VALDNAASESDIIADGAVVRSLQETQFSTRGRSIPEYVEALHVAASFTLGAKALLPERFCARYAAACKESVAHADILLKVAAYLGARVTKAKARVGNIELAGEGLGPAGYAP
jgi:hypothetical protein